MKYETIYLILNEDTNILYPILIVIVFLFVIKIILKYDNLTFGIQIYKYFASTFIFF